MAAAPVNATPWWSPDDEGDATTGHFASAGDGQGGADDDIDLSDILARVLALQEKLSSARRKLGQARKDNAALEEENARLEAELDELADERDSLLRRPRRGAGGPGGPSGGRSGLLADMTELEALEADLDDVADEDRVLRDRGFFGWFAGVIKRLRRGVRAAETRFVRSLPVSKQVAHLATRYGASLSVYFSFCAWLELNAFLQLLIFSPLLAAHCVDVATGAAAPGPEEASIGVGQVWFVFYSSFDTADAALYTAVLSSSVAAWILSTARRYIAERRAAQRIEVYGLGHDRLRFARAAFDSWDLSVQTPSQLAEAQAGVRDNLQLLVDESEREEVIAGRSAGERAALRARRVTGVLVSVAYTVAAWVLIIVLQLNNLAIQAWLDAQTAGLALLADFAVAVAVALINVVLPRLTMLVTDFEKWDYPATTLRMQAFRLYLGKILNLLINVAGYGILVARQNSDPPGVLEVPLLAGRSFTVQIVQPAPERFGCAENQVGTFLLLLCLVEFTVDKLVSLIKAGARRALLPLITGQPWQREPFKVAPKVINLIYFQALLWLCAPYFPFVTVAGPVLLHLTFLFDAALLRVAMAKPTNPWSADDVGAFFFRIYFITFAVALAWNYLFLRGEGVHACGAHVGAGTAWTAFEAWIGGVPAVSSFYAVLLNALILWVLLAVAWVRGSTNDSHKETLEEYAEVRIAQLAAQAEALDGKVRLQDRQLAALRRQAKGGRAR